MFYSKNNISYHFKKWGFLQSPKLYQAGMGNNNLPGYSASSQILTGFSASDTVTNEKCLHPCNETLNILVESTYVKLVNVIYF